MHVASEFEAYLFSSTNDCNTIRYDREREDPDDPEQLLLIDREHVNLGLENAISNVELKELDEGLEEFGGNDPQRQISFTSKQAKEDVEEVAVVTTTTSGVHDLSERSRTDC